jgi:Fe-S-cluster-containing dehydrogenase component
VSGDRRYWRSLERLRDSPALAAEGRLPEHLRPELAAGADLPPDGPTRRSVLGLMGASMGLAGLAGCRRPEEAIVPWVQAPEDVTPGLSRHYASTFPLAGSAAGVVVESHEGRPTKIEGNPRHPSSGGAASAWTQAAILHLYDPDRLRAPLRRERTVADAGAAGDAAGGDAAPDGAAAVPAETPPPPAERVAAAAAGAAEGSWADFVSAWGARAEALAADGGGLAVLAGHHASPTLARLAGELRRRFPRSRWVGWEPAGDDHAFDALGRRPVLHLDRARVVVALDADLLHTESEAVAHARGFAAGRRPDDGGAMNRLYAVEPAPTVTGANADHRVRLAASQVGAFAAALAAELGAGGDAAGELPAAVRRQAAAMASDLRTAGSAGLVAAGRRQPPRVHALAAAINRALGAEGTTVTYEPLPDGAARGAAAALAGLVAAMRRGEIDTLVVLGTNPVHAAPADLDFAGALERVPEVVQLTHAADETSAHAGWVLPEAGWLEAWGDARAAGGTASVVQPLIAPLFDGRSAIELVALLARGEEVPGHDLVRETWQDALGGAAGGFETAWRRALHAGVLPDAAAPAGAGAAPAAAAPAEAAAEEGGPAEGGRAADGGDPAAAASAPEVSPVEGAGEAAVAGDGELELIFALSPSVHDGRFANVAWLQEMPDPVTKVTWDNPARVSPATAAGLGLEDGDVAVLGAHGRSVELPVVVQPGQADGTVVVELGYGRRAAGRVGSGVGADVYPLRTSAAPWFVRGASLAPAGGRARLARTQEHGSMEGRNLVREATLDEHRRDPRVAAHGETEAEAVELWQRPELDGTYQWGMTVDLAACTGCNACVVACQSENNVPVVGPDQVSKGRELQWLRVDRYYAGDAAEPDLVFQPVPCMHCENAPCEQVCPVAATVHDAEGINAMVYNRCIGTRYCSNNCPYKVRRFNYFNFTRETPELVRMAMNPDVTVRSRGVMEKCTYCIQRINEGKAAAKREGRRLADGEVRTACQQTCPSQAITFGDLTDPDSAVSRSKRSPRNYVLLAELHNLPRTSYLARIRNPNPDWPASGGARSEATEVAT